MTEQEKELSAWYVIGTIILSILLLVFVFCTQAHAQSAPLPAFTESNIIRAGIGEAASEGYEGLYAVSCAIFNRGTLKGVYGFKSRQVDKEPLWVWQMARRAYLNAKEAYSAGACQAYGTHWESVKFKEPYWAKNMIKTVKIGSHIFYKERK